MMMTVTAREVRPLFSPRSKKSHKGDFGHLLLIGGSETKPGAILLAGRAALRTGSGLVTVALPDKAFKKFPKGFLELMYEPLPSNAAGTLSRKGWRKIEKILEGKNAVAVGPGMGVNADTTCLVKEMAGNFPSTLPLVLDADALNCLSLIKDAFTLLRGRRVVLTPHPGEMARLTGSTTKGVQSKRLGLAREFSVKNQVWLVLKGFETVIATPTGEVFVNSSGNPGMATAGMGDLLTGMIGSLAGQGMEFEKAVVAAVYLHGRAGDRVTERIGEQGLLASDVVEEIPLTLKELTYS